jgi:hypothetical protein
VTSGLEVSAAASAPGSSSALATSTPTSTSSAASTMAAPGSTTAGGPFPLVRGGLPIQVDRFVVVRGVGGGFVPPREVMEGTFAGGVVLPIAGATGVGELGIRSTIELVCSFAEEGDPFLMRISVPGRCSRVEVEEGYGCPFLHDLEGGYFQTTNNGI